ncbi:hypothetical protein [Actinokineospora sp. NPDC004072]
MPTPPRRRPSAAPTTRRPRVAGLRKPPRPEPAPATEHEQAPPPETSTPTSRRAPQTPDTPEQTPPTRTVEHEQAEAVASEQAAEPPAPRAVESEQTAAFDADVPASHPRAQSPDTTEETPTSRAVEDEQAGSAVGKQAAAPGAGGPRSQAVGAADETPTAREGAQAGAAASEQAAASGARVPRSQAAGATEEAPTARLVEDERLAAIAGGRADAEVSGPASRREPQAVLAEETAGGDDDATTAVVTDGIVTATPAANSDEDHEESVARRPSPTGKRRAGGRAAPADLAVAERSAGGPTRAKTSVDPGKRAVNTAIAVAVVALLLAAVGLYAKGQADRLSSGADRANAAFTDPAATAEVKTRISTALERALSYDYRDLDRTAAAVREVLAGRAVCEYEAMFGQLKELAPAQKLVHTTIVRELGVRSLSADRAEALVFIDQTSTRVDEAKTTASGAQLGVTAERVDGSWKITSFDTFNQPLPNGQPLPQC